MEFPIVPKIPQRICEIGDVMAAWDGIPPPAKQYSLALASPYTYYIYSWIGISHNNAGFGFLDLAPSILHSNWFGDYIS
jgi:hypothetical protein